METSENLLRPVCRRPPRSYRLCLNRVKGKLNLHLYNVICKTNFSMRSRGSDKAGRHEPALCAIAGGENNEYLPYLSEGVL